MATAKPHVYKVSKSHPIASKLKPGQMMQSRMKMMPPDEEGEDADYNMEEQESSPYTPPPATKKRPASPAEALKIKRQMT